MRFAFSDEQRSFQRSVREVLARVCAPTMVREAWTSASGRSRERWRAMVDLGVVGALIPEAQGGLGMTEVDLILAIEETGRAALPEPIVETAAVVAPLLSDVGGATCEEWVTKIGSGVAIASIGLETQPFVTDAHAVDLLVLQRGDALHAIDPKSVALQPQRSVDGARRLYRVEWSPSSSSLLCEGPRALTAIASAKDRAAVAFAAQLLGLARQLVERTVEYAKLRTQFGQPIGSFQAVKHALANAHLAVEMAAPMVYRAAHSLAHGLSERSVHASMAKARASEAAMLATRVALQGHGAIGYSHEHDLHLWMKRAWALGAAWGDAAHHRARISASLFDAST